MIQFTPIFEIPLGPIAIYTHGLMIAVGILVGYFLMRQEVRRRPEFSLELFDSAVFWSVLSGIIGARLLYVALNYHLYSNVADVLKLWEGGMISFGGLIGGFGAAAVYFKLKIKSQKSGSILTWLDMGTPYVFLGWGIARIGDFLSWSEIGSVTSLPWGIVVGTDSPRHPAQLYSTVAFTGMFFLYKWLSRQKQLVGFVFSAGVIGYGVIRFLTEFVRDYPDSEYRFAYGTFAQAMSLGLVILGIILYYYSCYYTRRRNSVDDASNT